MEKIKRSVKHISFKNMEEYIEELKKIDLDKRFILKIEISHNKIIIEENINEL